MIPIDIKGDFRASGGFKFVQFENPWWISPER